MKGIESIEIKDFNKEFGAFIVINSSECESWAEGGENPLIQIATSVEDFFALGFNEVDMKFFETMKVGDKVNHLEIGGDYEGVYIMRVG